MKHIQRPSTVVSVVFVVSAVLFLQFQSRSTSPPPVMSDNVLQSQLTAAHQAMPSAETPVIPAQTWARRYGGDANHIALAVTEGHDGTYLVVGVRTAPASLITDAWVMDISGSGDIVWQKNYSLPNSSSADFRSVAPTPDGGYLVVGLINCSASDASARALKIDQWGDIVWQKIYRTGLQGCTWTVHASNDGGYLVAANSGGDAWVLKLDEDGNIIRQKRFGGNNTNYALSVVATTDGGWTMMGETASFGAGAFDIWALHADSAGNAVWQKTYGGSGDDFPHSMLTTGDQGYIIAANTVSFGAGAEDAFLIRLDQTGNTVWQKTIGSAGNDEVWAMVAASDGGFVFTGSTQSTIPPLSAWPPHGIWVTKVDDGGSIIWQKSYLVT